MRTSPAPPVPAAVLAALLAAVLLLLGGCTHDPAARPRAPATPAPRLGGPHLQPHRPPHARMNRLERPVARQLARKVAHEGLSLNYLDCPDWNGAMPRTLTCRGFVDGVVGRVEVSLRAPVRGTAVSFDAWLAGGVIATRTLEDTLRRQHLGHPDCGRTPAYPARVGLRVVCRGLRGGEPRYVVATVRNRRGGVTISSYPGASGER
ncbi:MAG TPA: hypothetical protein VFX52_05855 [Nocardioidaceae bacterium]|nr:hypothetical protein [Nocardioidaceae bacterium]